MMGVFVTTDRPDLEEYMRKKLREPQDTTEDERIEEKLKKAKYSGKPWSEED